MFIVYSKKTGNIINTALGGVYNSIKDLFPYDYEDYELIYDTINLEDDQFVFNNQSFFKIIDGKLILKDDKFDKYRTDKQ